MSPLVSIVVPVYNKGKHLAECLDSILRQTYTYWECVICDNCSTDNSYEIASIYAAKDSRFRLYKNKELLPPVKNWNNTYSKISPNTKYVKLEPADDWMFPMYLEYMVQKLEKFPSAGICLSYRLNHQTVDCDGVEYRANGFFSGTELLFQEMKGEIAVTGSLGTPLYRVSTLKKLSPNLRPYNEENIHADTELALDVLAVADACFVYNVLSFIRRDNSTITSSIQGLETFYYSSELQYYKMVSRFPELSKQYRALRHRYAYFLFLMMFKRKNSVVNWHMSKLKRRMSFNEYLIGIVKYNFLTQWFL